MQPPFVELCMFLLLIAPVNCLTSTANYIFDWVRSGFKYVKEFFIPKLTITDGDLHFFLYSRKTGKDGNVEKAFAEFSANGGKIFFIIHGYLSGRNHTWYRELTHFILNRYPEAMVAQVSWEGLATKWYTTSTKYTEEIGKQIRVNKQLHMS